MQQASQVSSPHMSGSRSRSQVKPSLSQAAHVCCVVPQRAAHCVGGGGEGGGKGVAHAVSKPRTPSPRIAPARIRFHSPRVSGGGGGAAV